jgi:hypothetical protein
MSESFRGVAEPVPPAVRTSMTGVSWQPHPRCPPFDALRLLRLRHHDFDGAVRDGELIVAAAVAADVLAVFERLFALRFPIARMELIDAYGGDDERSMAANNCSAFNFRTIAGTEMLSLHAHGTAVDINPVQNPYLASGTIQPAAAEAFLDRSQVRAGMIVRPGPMVEAFSDIGWEWGGDWQSRKDYHHFCIRL